MKVVAIVQARLRSKRLPMKTLLPLPTGLTVLEECVHRCKSAKLVDQVVVAIPDTEECDILKLYCGSAMVVRGPEDDVLERYRRAAEVSGADVIVRVTSDCPIIPPKMIDKVITRRAVHGLAYATNCLPPSWPLGYTCEAFTASALRWEAANNYTAEAREHVTDGLRRKAERAKDVNEPCPFGDFSHIRWTLDTPDDYIEIWRAMDGARNAMDMLEVMRA